MGNQMFWVFGQKARLNGQYGGLGYIIMQLDRSRLYRQLPLPVAKIAGQPL